MIAYKTVKPNEHCRCTVFGVPADLYVDGNDGFIITEPDTFPVFYRYKALNGKTFASLDLNLFECECVHVSECDYKDDEKVEERRKIAASMRKATGQAFTVLYQEAWCLNHDPDKFLPGGSRCHVQDTPHDEAASGNIDASMFDSSGTMKDEAGTASDAGGRRRGLFALLFGL